MVGWGGEGDRQEQAAGSWEQEGTEQAHCCMALCHRAAQQAATHHKAAAAHGLPQLSQGALNPRCAADNQHRLRRCCAGLQLKAALAARHEHRLAQCPSAASGATEQPVQCPAHCAGGHKELAACSSSFCFASERRPAHPRAAHAARRHCHRPYCHPAPAATPAISAATPFATVRMLVPHRCSVAEQAPTEAIGPREPRTSNLGITATRILELCRRGASGWLRGSPFSAV